MRLPVRLSVGLASALLAFSALRGIADGGIPPQLLTLLEYYFRGAGASNAIHTFQISDGAVTIAKIDTNSAATVFATRLWASSEFVETEIDPVWALEKVDYTTTNVHILFVTAVTNRFVAIETNMLSKIPISCLVTSMAPFNATNYMEIVMGAVKTNIVREEVP